MGRPARETASIHGEQSMISAERFIYEVIAIVLTGIGFLLFIASYIWSDKLDDPEE